MQLKLYNVADLSVIFDYIKISSLLTLYVKSHIYREYIQIYLVAYEFLIIFSSSGICNINDLKRRRRSDNLLFADFKKWWSKIAIVNLWCEKNFGLNSVVFLLINIIRVTSNFNNYCFTLYAEYYVLLNKLLKDGNICYWLLNFNIMNIQRLNKNRIFI